VKKLFHHELFVHLRQEIFLCAKSIKRAMCGYVIQGNFDATLFSLLWPDKLEHLSQFNGKTKERSRMSGAILPLPHIPL
jgi:hypothetical protein